MQQAICEHEGSTGVWIWANLISPRCVMLHLPWKHVKRLAICRPKTVFVSLLARCDLLGALGASAGRRRCVVGDVVSITSLPVPCQSAAVQSRRPCRLHVVGNAWADIFCVRLKCRCAVPTSDESCGQNRKKFIVGACNTEIPLLAPR